MKIKITQPQFLHIAGTNKINEDYIFPESGSAKANSRFLVVCDGIGGKGKGDVAAKIVAERISSYFENQDENYSLQAYDVEEAVKKAEQALSAHQNANESTAGMGSTFSMIYLGESNIGMAWIGNSPIYHYHEKSGKLLHINSTPFTSEGANITQVISGEKTPVVPSVNRIEFSSVGSGDYFLLCTDGLLELTKESALTKLFQQGLHPAKIIEKLTSPAAPTQDDYSCYLFQINTVPSQFRGSTTIPEPEASRRSSYVEQTFEKVKAVPNLGKYALLTLGLLAIGAFAIYMVKGGFSFKKRAYERYMEMAEERSIEQDYTAAKKYYDSAYNATQDATELQIAYSLAQDADSMRIASLSNPDAYIQLGNGAMQSSQFQEAMEHYLNALDAIEANGKGALDFPYDKLALAYIERAEEIFPNADTPEEYALVNQLYSIGFSLYDDLKLTVPNDKLHQGAKANYDWTSSLIQNRGDQGIAESRGPQPRGTGPDVLRKVTIAQNRGVEAQNKPRSLPSGGATPTSSKTTSSTAGKAALRQGIQTYNNARLSNSNFSYQKSREYLEQAGDQLNGKGAYLLAYMYHMGQGGKKNPKLALQYARKSAYAGWPSGHYLYGHMLVSRNNPVDRKNGMIHLERAALKGHRQAYSKYQENLTAPINETSATARLNY